MALKRCSLRANSRVRVATRCSNSWFISRTVSCARRRPSKPPSSPATVSSASRVTGGMSSRVREATFNTAINSPPSRIGSTEMDLKPSARSAAWEGRPSAATLP